MPFPEKPFAHLFCLSVPLIITFPNASLPHKEDGDRAMRARERLLERR
jgi:hypothetical protein